MRQPVYRTRDGVDVYADRTPAGGTEQYGIRRIPAHREGVPTVGPYWVTGAKDVPARYVYVPSVDLDPFEEVAK